MILKKKYILLLYLTICCFDTFAAGSASADIAIMFRQLVTRGVANTRQNLHHTYSNAYLHHHWRRPWHYDPVDHFNNVPAQESHSKFYTELYNRFEVVRKDPSSKLSPIGVKEIKAFDEDEELDEMGNPKKNGILKVGDKYAGVNEAKVLERAQSGFIEGHLIPFDYTTAFPYILVTAFAKNTLQLKESREEGKPLRWFTTLEQALACYTLGDYRQRIALLKDWDAYSNFAILVVPPDTNISYFLGSVAPKAFPKLGNITKAIKAHKDDKSIYFTTSDSINSIYEFIATHNLSLGEAAKLCETLGGGATQLYIKSVSNFYLYEVPNSLLFPSGTPFNITYPTKKDEKWEMVDGVSHLTCPSFDKALINLHGQLKDWGIITDSEHEEISSIVKGLYDQRVKELKELEKLLKQ